MEIREQEHKELFKSWCKLNNLKPSSGRALGIFCAFSKQHFQVLEEF